MLFLYVSRLVTSLPQYSGFVSNRTVVCKLFEIYQPILNTSLMTIHRFYMTNKWCQIDIYIMRPNLLIEHVTYRYGRYLVATPSYIVILTWVTYQRRFNTLLKYKHWSLSIVTLAYDIRRQINTIIISAMFVKNIHWQMLITCMMMKSGK